MAKYNAINKSWDYSLVHNKCEGVFKPSLGPATQSNPNKEIALPHRLVSKLVNCLSHNFIWPHISHFQLTL